MFRAMATTLSPSSPESAARAAQSDGSTHSANSLSLILMARSWSIPTQVRVALTSYMGENRMPSGSSMSE